MEYQTTATATEHQERAYSEVECPRVQGQPGIVGFQRTRPKSPLEQKLAQQYQQQVTSTEHQKAVRLFLAGLDAADALPPQYCYQPSPADKAYLRWTQSKLTAEAAQPQGPETTAAQAYSQQQSRAYERQVA